MRFIVMGAVLIAAPVSAERKVVSVGDNLVEQTMDRRVGVEVATTQLSIDRAIYLVDRISLPAGAKLQRRGAPGRYCTDQQGYVKSGSGEVSICLRDTTSSGSFDEATGPEISRPVHLKVSVPYSLAKETVWFPATIPKRIVYLGGSKTEAKFSYREFTSEGLARPAFTEDLTIPLESFPVSITLKGFKMTIYGQNSSGIDVDISQ